SDPDPAVATWSTFLTAIQNPPKRPAIIQTLITEPDPTRQMLGLLISNMQPIEQQKQWATTALAAKPHEMIKLYATGMLEMAEYAAAHPTTDPTDGTGSSAVPAGSGAPGGSVPLFHPVG